jgi:hypothetical protein
MVNICKCGALHWLQPLESLAMLPMNFSRLEANMMHNLDSFTDAELETMMHFETVLRYAERIRQLEILLRQILRDGLTKEMYKQIGDALNIS